MIGIDAYAAYRAFWHRFLAAMLDGLLFVPLTLSIDWAKRLTQSGVWYVASDVGTQAVVIGYTVWMHARYGQTLGKMAVRVRVIDAGGVPNITLKQAWLRSSPEIAIGLVLSAIYAPAVIGSTDPANALVGVVAARFALVLTMGWFGLELVTMLTNPKRRALHDYLAGTAVVRLDRYLHPAADPSPARS